MRRVLWIRGSGEKDFAGDAISPAASLALQALNRLPRAEAADTQSRPQHFTFHPAQEGQRRVQTADRLRPLQDVLLLRKPHAQEQRLKEMQILSV